MLDEPHRWETIIFAPEDERDAFAYELQCQLHWGLRCNGGTLYNTIFGGGADEATGQRARQVVLAQYEAKRRAYAPPSLFELVA